MAKMFYTLDEAKTALGKSEDEIKQFAREGRLREFRDGPRLMFKADQVEQLKSDLGSGDNVDLGVSDSGGLIGLVDTSGASGTSDSAENQNTVVSGRSVAPIVRSRIETPAVSSAPKMDCISAPPRSRCRSAVPDAIPTRVGGTDPVSDCAAGVWANPTPMPANA